MRSGLAWTRVPVAANAIAEPVKTTASAAAKTWTRMLAPFPALAGTKLFRRRFGLGLGRRFGCGLVRFRDLLFGLGLRDRGLGSGRLGGACLLSLGLGGCFL